MIQIEIILIGFAGIQLRLRVGEIDAGHVVFPTEARQRVGVIQKARNGEVVRRHVGIDEDQQLGALLRDEVAVFQQHLPRLRQKVIDVTRVFADDLLANHFRGALVGVAARIAAAHIGHARVERRADPFIGSERPQGHADGLPERAERIAEHERAIDVPAVLLGDAVIIAELLKRGGEEGQQIVLPLDALPGAVHGERLNDQYRPFRAVFAVQLACRGDVALQHAAGNAEGKAGLADFL